MVRYISIARFLEVVSSVPEGAEVHTQLKEVCYRLSGLDLADALSEIMGRRVTVRVSDDLELFTYSWANKGQEYALEDAVVHKALHDPKTARRELAELANLIRRARDENNDRLVDILTRRHTKLWHRWISKRKLVAK